MTCFAVLLRPRVLFTCALAFGALAGADHAVAQSRSMTAEVPFAFQDGSHMFPAGRYLIRCGPNNMISVESTTGDSLAINMTIGELRGQATDRGKLIFHKYGDEYFLSDVWLARSESGRKLLPSRAEKELRGSPSKRPAAGTQIALNVGKP